VRGCRRVGIIGSGRKELFKQTVSLASGLRELKAEKPCLVTALYGIFSGFPVSHSPPSRSHSPAGLWRNGCVGKSPGLLTFTRNPWMQNYLTKERRKAQTIVISMRVTHKQPPADSS
jgi:hypothetical protein